MSKEHHSLIPRLHAHARLWLGWLGCDVLDQKLQQVSLLGGVVNQVVDGSQLHSVDEEG